MENEKLISTLKTAWVIYIVCCRDGSYYTGITTDLARRITEHNSAEGGAKYTRPRRPVTLVYSESVPSRSTATHRENQIKKLSVAAKSKLIAGDLGSESPRVQSLEHPEVMPEDSAS